jgi:hypothetical protein
MMHRKVYSRAIYTRNKYGTRRKKYNRKENWMRCEAVYLYCSVYGCYLLVGFPKCGAEEGEPLLVQVVLAVAAAQAPLTGGGGAGHPRQGALLTYLTSYTQAIQVLLYTSLIITYCPRLGSCRWV